MKVKIRFFGDLIDFFGKNELTIELEEDAEIEDLISEIAENKKGFREKIEVLSERRGATDFGLTILVNGRNINVLEGLKTRLKEGDTVVFLPPAAGGSTKHKKHGLHVN